MNSTKLSIIFLLFLGFLTQMTSAQAAPSVDEIIQKVIKAEELNDQRTANYVYEESITIEKLDKKGVARKTREKKYLVISNPGLTYELKSLSESSETILVVGRPYEFGSSSVASKGAPTSVPEITPKPQAKKNTPLQYTESMQMAELVTRYEFTFVGEETIGKNRCYVLEFIPRKKVKPRSRVQKVLNVLTGKVWVDKNAFIIKACEAQLDKSVSMAWPFATLRDLNIKYLAAQVAPGVWMPAELEMETSYRVFLGKSYQRQTARMSNYRLLTPLEAEAIK